MIEEKKDHQEVKIDDVSQDDKKKTPVKEEKEKAVDEILKRSGSSMSEIEINKSGLVTMEKRSSASRKNSS